MLPIILSFILATLFWTCASACNAVMDNIQDHWSTSIFNKRAPEFWNPAISWKISEKIFGWKFDAWHVFKSIMILCICFSMSLYCYSFSLIAHEVSHINGLWFFLVFIYDGLLWNATFNIFYNKLLNR